MILSHWEGKSFYPLENFMGKHFKIKTEQKAAIVIDSSMHSYKTLAPLLGVVGWCDGAG